MSKVSSSDANPSYKIIIILENFDFQLFIYGYQTFCNHSLPALGPTYLAWPESPRVRAPNESVKSSWTLWYWLFKGGGELKASFGDEIIGCVGDGTIPPLLTITLSNCCNLDKSDDTLAITAVLDNELPDCRVPSGQMASQPLFLQDEQGQVLSHFNLSRLHSNLKVN